MANFYFLLFGLFLAAHGGILERSLDGENKVHIGTEPIESYPSIVSIQPLYNNGFRHDCGGTLVSDQHVLTAAHCYHEEAHKYRVVLGTRDKNEPYDYGSKWIEITNINWRLHSNYSKDNFYNHDIAIIELPGRVRPSANISPIRLATKIYTKDIRIVGWGRMNCRAQSPDRYLFARGELVDDRTCQNSWPQLHKNQFCLRFDNAFGERSNTDKGDSGGPLYAKLDDGSDIQIGAVSGGGIVNKDTPKECVDVLRPVWFNKIPEEIDFIREHAPTAVFV